MYFDSREERCKTPYGAVTCGTKLSFALYPDCGEDVDRAMLVAHGEFADSWEETELDLSDGALRCVYTAPAQPELVWYHFRIIRKDGSEAFFGKNGYRGWDELATWQLTVYDDSLKTPDWFGRGVSYQIFPDRFRRGKTRGVAGMIGKRTLHADWNEMLEYLPNAEGEITCSDFFGGDLAGIEEKLGYLRSLGVTTVYLNPIFLASSNHRYDTADYKRVDPLLGSEDDLKSLCERARAFGIHVILDGVFNHTGSNSVYFNAEGTFPELGAAQSQDSPYYSWYHFTRFPDEYNAWWGFKTLPDIEETSPSYMDFIIDGEDSVVRHWLRAGASGWRLDVADELPGVFIERIRRVMEQDFPDAYLLGEVWEDGSNKIAYSTRRKYLLGRQTHGLMNYPFRNALLGYLLGGRAEDFREAMETLRENYPPAAFYGAMNFLGTHDTPRILTVLGYRGTWPQSREERARIALNAAERFRAVKLLKLAALVMFAFPGSPTIYYGDEAGMQGFEDPFNRATYPWGREDHELISFFARLGALRLERASLQSGGVEYVAAQGPVLAFCRREGSEVSLAVCNAGDKEERLTLPWHGDAALDALTGERFRAFGGLLHLTLEPTDGALLIEG
ncbi:MAG: alpha-glucosidase C-terminal domain-containing protein [Oscillospiraceae bacterium]|nr:alpha-glucosidase C-terminal domain-containing protein [Oscillospiraceae bacterium]